MPSISSLLKSAESIQSRIRKQQDAEVAYEWQLSAKTYDDLQAYSKYLDEQANKTNDPSDLLSYRKAIDSAKSGYTSNEIQRQSISVLEGRTTNQQKMGALTNLYYSAVDNGNLDLAQGLRLQIDNLDLRLQQEAQAAQSLAGTMAALNAKNIDDAVDKIKGISQELDVLFKERGIDKFNSDLQGYAKEIGLEDADYFGLKLWAAEQVNKTYDEALQSDQDPDNQRKFQKAKNDFNTKNSITLPGANGRDLNVSYQDLVDQADAARTGQTVFRTVQGADGTTFERNKETGFVWGRDENGEYRAITIYKPNTDYTSTSYRTKVDSKGNTIYLDSKGQEVAIRGKDGNTRGLNGRSVEDAAKRDYRDLLKQGGFNVLSGDGSDYIEVANPGNLPGVSSETVRLYVNNDGKLQVVGDGEQFYNLDFDENTGDYLGLLKDEPNPITMLDDSFSKDFISKLDRPSLPSGAIGIVDTNLATSQLLRVGEFTRADIANKQQLAALEAARVEAAGRAAQAAQALQPALSPQAAPKVNLQAPSASVRRLQPTATVPLQSPSTASRLQGNQTGPQRSINIQQPSRGIRLQ